MFYKERNTIIHEIKSSKEKMTAAVTSPVPPCTNPLHTAGVSPGLPAVLVSARWSGTAPSAPSLCFQKKPQASFRVVDRYAVYSLILALLLI